MPIIKSAKKRVRVTLKATVRNAKTKRNLRMALKSFQTALNGDAHNKAQSALDKAGKKGLLHKNKIARKKRQLAVAAKKAGVKPAASKKSKTTAKKVAPKKAATKKTTVKKTVAKKK